MNTITYRFPLNVARVDYQRTLQGFHTGEILSRRMVISLVRGTEPYELPMDNSVVATMYVKKPGAEPSINACEIDVENNVIVYNILEEDIDTPGIVELQLKLASQRQFEPEKVIVSPKFTMEVEATNVDDNVGTTTPTYTALTEALAKANEYYNQRLIRVGVSKDHVLQFEYANGVIYEVDVINEAVDAKWEETLDTLQAYVDSASTSATEAFNYMTDAAASKNEAETFKDSADTSATSAAASALDAHVSELTSEVNRKDAEAWAVGTRDGKPLEPGDPIYHKSARDWAESAEQIVVGGNVVLYTPQDRTEAEKVQVRANIGALASSEKGAANGVASLNENGKVPTAQLPEFSIEDAKDVSAADKSNGDVLTYKDGVWEAEPINMDAKADKVADATNGNFASLDANGNLKDSGNKATDFIPKVSGGTNGNFASLDANGKLKDSGKKAADFSESGHTHNVSDLTAGTFSDKVNANATAVASGESQIRNITLSTTDITAGAELATGDIYMVYE